jgi:hypothetical protein
MKSKNCGKNVKHIEAKTPTIKAVANKNELSVAFFLEDAEESFLLLNKFPYGKIPLPAVGERINLHAYGEFDFDYFVVEENHYRYYDNEGEIACFLYVTVSGHFVPDTASEDFIPEITLEDND